MKILSESKQIGNSMNFLNSRRYFDINIMFGTRFLIEADAEG